MGDEKVKAKPIEIQISTTNVSTEESVKTIKRDFEHIVELQKYGARIRRANYLALIDSGFTKDQAMWLIK